MKKCSNIFLVLCTIPFLSACSSTKGSPLFKTAFMGIPIEYLFIAALVVVGFLYFKNRQTNQKEIDEFNYLETHSKVHKEMETNEKDDILEEELVAIITAAVSAASGLSEEEFIVRTIKRRNTKWQKVN